jgi:hypothetical protein
LFGHTPAVPTSGSRSATRCADWICRNSRRQSRPNFLDFYSLSKFDCFSIDRAA